MITLRADQEDARTKLRIALRTSTAVLLFAPTGFGKTVLASALIKLIAATGKRVIFCVHRVDLIRQTEKTFDKFGIAYSHIAAGYHYNQKARVFIASIATLARRLGKIPADYILVDEAQLSAAAGWAAVANHYRDNKAKLIGLSGSPERLDGKPLGDVWDVLVMGPSVRWLIEQGHLQRYRAFSPKGIDLSTARVSKSGEYNEEDIEKLMAGKAVLSNAVKHWRKYANGLRTIAFTRSTKASEELAQEFRDNGIMAVALDGDTPQEDRRRAFEGFADRDIKVIVNCQLFCEGFDLSAQTGRDVTVECVLDDAPTQSLAKHLQKNGRGLRKDDGPPHVLLDLVGNLLRHGFPDDEREWSLEGRVKKSKASGEEAMRICPECYAAFDPAPVCPECGHRHEVQAHVLEQVDGELEEVDVEAVRRQRAQEQWQARTLDDLVQLGIARNYPSPAKWAAKIFTARQAKVEARYG